LGATGNSLSFNNFDWYIYNNMTENKSPYHLEHYDTIPHEEILFRGISEEASRAKGLPPIRPFSIFIKDQKQNVLGGVSGTTFYGSLYVDSLWIDPMLRHQGWGTKLMHEAEQIGRERGARFVALNTMDWEALPFYQKLGYLIEFTREGYDKNSKMFMLRKIL
jgi:ribosomal protein S18 acetylase RimI-like enzyme